MLAQLIIAIILGIIAGTITGLIPGIHINLVAVLILSSFAVLITHFSILTIIIFIISMAITHTFLDFIPSTYLGAPSADTALSILPAHRLLLKGKGYHAIKLSTIGSLFSLLLAIIITPFLLISIPIIYPVINKYIAIILIVTSLLLIIRDKKSKLWAFYVFLLSGILGLTVLNNPLIKEPLFPMLSGLFGISMLAISINNKTKIPKQKISNEKISKKEVTKALFGCGIAGTITSFLPGLGPAQGAIIGSQMVRRLGQEGFLILVGGMNTYNMVLSFVALYTINKARNGAVVVISKILGEISLSHLVLFIGAALFTAGIATILSLTLAKNIY